MHISKILENGLQNVYVRKMFTEHLKYFSVTVRWYFDTVKPRFRPNLVEYGEHTLHVLPHFREAIFSGYL